MKVEGINFNEEKVKSMKKKDFIDECINTFFLDRIEADRKALLGRIYDDIAGKKKASIEVE